MTWPLRRLCCLAAVLAGCGADATTDRDAVGNGADGGTDAAMALDTVADTAVAADGDDAAGATDSAGDSIAPPADVTGSGTVVLEGKPTLLLVGTVVTPAQVFQGQVLLSGKTIACAEPGTFCEQVEGAAAVPRVETQGLILPGLIDMHNHILFDIFDNDDWVPAKSYQNHTEWPKEARYGAMLDVKQCLENASQGKPKWCPAPYNTKAGNVKCEMNKFGELKGLIAGTTSIVGLAGASLACFGSVARSVDTAQNDLGVDKIQTSALFPPSPSAADGVCKNFASGDTEAYLIHCGEGLDAKTKAQYQTLTTVSTEDGCLIAPGTVITHGTAFDAAEFSDMAAKGVKLTWSPASNIALYGNTTNIPAALDAGVLVSLGPDWSMGGSQNMLDELRFADAWDNKHWNNRLSPKDLLTMATVNAAASLGQGDRLGQIKAGYMADLFVIEGDAAAPYDSLLKATPAEVKLVAVGGKLLYGDDALLDVAKSGGVCEQVKLCGRDKFFCIAEASSADKFDQTVSQITAILEKAMLDMDAATPTDGWNFAPLTPLVKCAQP